MIQLTNLTKQYSGKTAVNNLSFSIKPGVITGFLGPNGAGKTTTMRMIVGLTAPSEGSILIDGTPHTAIQKPLSHVGAMLDTSAIDTRLTPQQYLRILSTMAGLPMDKVDALLSFVGLHTVANQRIGTFSFGMKQRVGIAGALVGDPKTIMMDEPFNGLDVQGIHWLRDLLRNLAAQGKAVLISSHLLSEVQEIADQIIVVARGALIANMSIDALQSKSASAYVQVQSSDMEALRKILSEHGAKTHMDADGTLQVRHMDSRCIGDLAFDGGIRIYALVHHQPSLEALFSELVEGKGDFEGTSPLHGKEVL